MTTMIINLMITLTLNKEIRLEYNTMKECEIASNAIVKTLDKLNESQNLGYAWKCIPSNKK